jgi:hypothetical protein
MTETTDRRRNDRFAIRLEAHYSFGRVVEVGVLANISYSGALIEDVTMQPKIGTRVVLQVQLTPASDLGAVTPVELAGNVVRHSPNGFAIEYEDGLDPDSRQMVDDVAAIVSDRR